MRPNNSLHRTAPAPRLVMPLAVSMESFAAKQRIISYHVYHRVIAASVTPMLGAGRCR